MKDKKIHTLVMTVFMQRTFAVLCFILLSVLTTLGATVTETFTVSSSITAPSAGDVIGHTTNVSVQYGASTTSSAISNEEIPTFSLDDTYYYIKRSGGTKKCEVNSSGAMEGVFFALTSKVDGSLTVTLYNGHSSSALSYAIYTISNNSKTNTGSTSKIAAGSFGTHTMQVSAGVTYYFHTNGTGNMGFAGYTFTYDSNTWTSSVTGGSIPYTVHTPSSQANDQNSKPMTVVYLTNLGFDNISTVSNTDNITWLCNQGYQVIALDYGKNSNAVSPKINADIISINSSLMTGSFCNQTCSPLRSYILMEGYRIERDIAYYKDDPTVYNWPGGQYTSDNPDWLYLDLIYPASPSKEVPVLVTFSYSNSYAASDLSNANMHQRMNLGNFWGNYKDSFVEGVPAVGFAWAVCDHPKYCNWGQGKYTGGANKSLASIEVNPDAARKVKAAIRTVRGKGKDLGLNGAVAVTGFSRGSTAASLAVGDGDIATFEDMTRGVSDYASQSSKVQCAVLGPGMFDYQSATESSNDYKNMNTYVTGIGSTWDSQNGQQGALATIQTKASAPTLFYHNNDDYYHEDSKGLYATQAQTMKAKLDNLGVSTETLTGYSSGHAVPQDETNLKTMYDFLTTHTVVETSTSVLSVGTELTTVTNDYIYAYDKCNGEPNGWPTTTTQLMDCVYSGGYVKFKIRPSVDGDYKLTSFIATANDNRYVTITCNGQSIMKIITNNGGWSGGNSYDWIFTGLKAGTDYEVDITCTDPNESEYQVNVFTTTIQWVETTGDDSGSTETLVSGGDNITQIDFDYVKDGKYQTEDGYTSWVVDASSASKTIEGVTVDLSTDDNFTIKYNWYKNLWNGTSDLPQNKLISDGIIVKTSDGSNPSKAVSLYVKLKGLKAGNHTLLAYMNNLDGDTSSKYPNIKVSVDNEFVEEVVQTVKKEKTIEAACVYIPIISSGENDEIKLTFTSLVENDVTYKHTGFYINAIEIDRAHPKYYATEKSPSTTDYHAERYDNGDVPFTWTSAEGATKHIVYFGTDEESVENGTSEVIKTTSNSITKSGLSPLTRYYWRVDEVIDGKAYKGDVMSFQPRRDAFPGAEGYGRYAIGGRGWNGNGEVYHVTSLKDDGSEGTFRYGIENATVPTTIVFDVSGVIHLQSRLTNSNPYVTIAGQTAPGNGIMFRGAPFGMATDGITRFMRLRRGDIVIDGNTMTITLEKDGEKYTKEVPADCGKGLDGMGMAGNNHSIMDHCSIGWTIDEAFSSRNAKNITLQKTLISEALNIAGHPNYDDGTGHGYAATIGGDKGSYHHNLLAHNAGRNWSMGGGHDGAGAYAGKADMFNNVCYNWTTRTTDGGVHNGQFVNNYYKMGPASTHTLLFTAELEGAGSGTQEYYVNGNIRQAKDNGAETTHSYKAEGDGNIYKYELSGGQVLDWTVFVNKPYFDSWATIETAKAAFKNVLSDVGCNYAGLDNHDVRMVSETLHGTTSTTGSKGKLAGIIDATTDTGCEGFDGLNIETDTRPANWDTDKDGIPAWFEGAKGWSDAAANNNADSDGDYYTDLEEYLNWVAEPHFIGETAGEGLASGTDHTITLSTYFAGYTSPSYSVTSDGGMTVNINNGVLTFNAPSSLNGKLVTVKVTASESNISLTREFNIFINGEAEEETPEEKEYSLSQETYSYSNKTTTWYFENGFTVTNNNSKGKSNGSDNTIKYSNEIVYTINIPEGMSVNSIKFYGFTNEDNVTGYLSELNGTSYTATGYVFPSGKNTDNRAEHTITFAKPVTNTITFTFVKQCAIAITLYATGGTEVEETDLAPAFPGAEGHGRYAQGGRGTDGFTNVYHVTSLADDGSKGTLRWALAQDAPRTIVFDVSGYIDLTDELQIPSYTTIAGQTAPEPGITLRYYTVNTNNSKNVIIRYMRFRRSQVKNVNDGADAAWGKNGKNIILDHCSFSWSIDEVASFYDNRNFTMQWCVLGEGLCTAGHGKDSHSYGGIWGGKNASFHHNMITNVQNRAPRLCGARYKWSGYDRSKYDNSVQAERVDVRNNLYYNWGNGNGAYGGMGGYHNLVNNYYKAGPETKNKERVFEGGVVGNDDSQYGLPADLPGRFYINGNYVTAAEGQKENYDWNGFIQRTVEDVFTSDLTYTDSQGWYGTAGETVSIKLDNAIEAGEVTTHTAEEAYEKVRTYGGASLYRDDVDVRYMEDAADCTTSYTPTVSEVKTAGIVDLINDPEAVANNELPSFPMLAVVERPANWDTDRDGIPDAWEDANDLDKKESADGNAYTLDKTKQWYTNLEVYLNSIVEDITKKQNENSTGTTIEIENEYYPTWKEPDVTELEEFVLSNDTHSSGADNEWTFNNGFTITGQSGSTYGNADNYIKYSDGYEYTITVPSNVTVSRVKIEGYSDTAVGGDKAYLATLGTQTFDATKYVFPNSDASVNTASYEFTLPTAVTGGTLKIKATGAQTCLIVTLYGEEKSYDLGEVANEMTVEEGSSVDVEYTIDRSTYKEANDDGTQYTFVSGEETFVMTRKNGKNIEYGNKNILENSIKYSNGQTFTISIPDGITITNFKVTGYSNSDSNDGSIKKINGKDVSGYTFPAITEDASKEQTRTYDIKMDNVTGELSFVPEQQCCFVITLRGTKTISSKKTTVTLDEMATVHSLGAADNVTVEMKRGLTAGAWNTFCVPFNLTKTELEAALDDDVEVVKYTKQEGTTLHFENIKDTEEMLAGTPYLIKPASFSSKYSADMTPITFEGVNLVAADVKSNKRQVVDEVRPSAADYSFVGTYVRYIMETDGTELGLNSKNKLAKPAASTNIMRGLRGFFRYNTGNGAGAKVVINGTLTSIDEIDGGTAGAKGVYHVSGRYVRSEWNNGSGLPRGLYIVDGQKMVK